MFPSKGESPFKWPFPPRPKASGTVVARRTRSRRGGSFGLSRKAMLADIVLVLCWGASIPGLMWLGAAGGF